LDNKFSIQPELLLSQKGFKSESIHLDAITTTARFYYLNLPLLFRYKPIENFALLAGPEFGLLLRASGKREDREDWDEFTRSYKRRDFGLVVGANYDVTPAMAVELRYSHGMTKQLPFKGLNEMQNRVVQIGLAYKVVK
jgi:hypothetical protein